MNQIPTGIDMGSAVDRLLGAGRTLWLAGVGAVAEVSEGGLEMFDRLVERGRPVEERQKRRVQAVTDRVSRAVDEARKLVEDTVQYESRGVLQRLNVMTREDVKLLGSRIGTLSKKIDEYVARRQTAPLKAVEIVEIVSPEGEAVAIVTPEIPTAASKPKKASRPRQKKATR